SKPVSPGLATASVRRPLILVRKGGGPMRWGSESIGIHVTPTAPRERWDGCTEAEGSSQPDGPTGSQAATSDVTWDGSEARDSLATGRAAQRWDGCTAARPSLSLFGRAKRPPLGRRRPPRLDVRK